MMIHPPMLYTGYVGFSIPFAFAIGALIARRTGADWIRATRRFALIAWTFLGTGIMLGALWSYTELGWGGYWAWDPVENASVMPWLVGTAFLHSIMVQEKRGMLKIWNVSLICATFTLALMGTFLVRSGILESIHAFGASTIGVQFLVLHRPRDRRLGGADHRRLPDLRSRGAARLAALARGVLPAEQPRARGALPRDLLGHLLPADLGGDHGHRGERRAALVRPAGRAAGARARAAHGNRADARVAAVSALLAAAHPDGAARGGRGYPRRAAVAHRRGGQPAVARDVLPGRLRAGRGGAGALARRHGAPHDERRVLAAGAGAARRPQPPPLRRLPGARRHRGAVPRGGGVVGLHRAARRASVARGTRSRWTATT